MTVEASCPCTALSKPPAAQTAKNRVRKDQITIFMRGNGNHPRGPRDAGVTRGSGADRGDQIVAVPPATTNSPPLSHSQPLKTADAWTVGEGEGLQGMRRTIGSALVAGGAAIAFTAVSAVPAGAAEGGVAFSRVTVNGGKPIVIGTKGRSSCTRPTG